MEKMKIAIWLSVAIIAAILTLACLAGVINCAIGALNGSIAAIENGLILEIVLGLLALLTVTSALKAEKLLYHNH